MSDLVKRLREAASDYRKYSSHDEPMLDEAADRIEQLEESYAEVSAIAKKWIANGKRTEILELQLAKCKEQRDMWANTYCNSSEIIALGLDTHDAELEAIASEGK